LATHQDLLDAIARVRTATGDPDGWTAGLSGQDVAAAINPLSTPAVLGAVLAKVVGAHPEVFGSGARPGPAPPAPQPEGVAAEAIRDAEDALAQRKSAAAQVDLQVVTAVLNAHASHADGVAELDRLQREIEDAVAARVDLDTPGGARAFQQYLIGRLRDIRAVVETAGLDSGSRAALAAALAAMYAAASPENAAGDHDSPEPADERSDEDGEGDRDAGHTGEYRNRGPLDPPGWDPEPLGAFGDDFGPAPLPESAPAPAALPPAAGWGGVPAAAPFGGGMAPAPAGGLPNFPADPLFARPGFPGGEPGPLTERDADEPPGDPEETTDQTGPEETGPEETGPDAPGEEPPMAGATTVELPDGRTVTAPTPELAAVITAAVAGTPIAEAFGEQGITVPEPGTPVIGPVDVQQLLPGDIGVLADRHALALGDGTVLLDQRIGPISSVLGPDFLGWQHPPAPQTPPMPAPPEVPAPVPSAPTAPS